MSARGFLSPGLRAKAVEAIRQVERQTSAELVVALRKRSGSYRHADYLFGVLLVLAAAVAVEVLAPPSLPSLSPLDLALVFLVGAGLCAYLPPLRRLLAGAALQRHHVLCAARAAFVEMGISRTSARGGILVYVSMLERRVEVVADLGLNTALMGEEWRSLVEELRRSVRELDEARFIPALEALGPILGRHHPRQADDRNELPDEVSAP